VNGLATLLTKINHSAQCHYAPAAVGRRVSRMYYFVPVYRCIAVKTGRIVGGFNCFF